MKKFIVFFYPLLIDFQVSVSPAWEDSFICSLNEPFFQYNQLRNH